MRIHYIIKKYHKTEKVQIPCTNSVVFLRTSANLLPKKIRKYKKLKICSGTTLKCVCNDLGFKHFPGEHDPESP